MSKLILPRRFSNQPQVPVGPSELAKQLNVGALLLPTGSGWADATGRFERTGGTGSVVRVPTPSGMARTSSVGSAWADFVLDRGFHNPANGYAWVMRGSLKSVLGNWGGIIARTVNNATGQGWSWQRANADVLTVYHAGSGYSNAGTLSQFVDGEEHTFVGVWRKSESRLELWVDGALRWSKNSASAAPAYTAGQGQIKVMSSRDTANIHASVTMVGVFNGSLSAEVAREISINPWQLFKPQRQVLYFDIGGGGVTGTLSVTLENFTSSINGTTTIVGTIAQTMAAFTSAITGTSEVPGTIAATTEAAVGALEGTVGTDGPTGTITGLVEDSMASMAGSTSIVGTMNVTLEENTSSITGTTTVVGQMAASVAGFVSFIYGTSGLQTATNRLLALIGVGK